MKSDRIHIRENPVFVVSENKLIFDISFHRSQDSCENKFISKEHKTRIFY